MGANFACFNISWSVDLSVLSGKLQKLTRAGHRLSVQAVPLRRALAEIDFPVRVVRPVEPCTTRNVMEGSGKT